MNVLIIGASGFIGRELVKELDQNGHRPVAVTRNTWHARDILGKSVTIVEWDGISPVHLAKALMGIDAVVNLAGENIGSGRWTDRRKRKIINSRINTGKVLKDAIKISNAKPSVLIQGSAIGYYGYKVDEPADENHPAGTGFVAALTEEWELSVSAAATLVPRIVFLRTGLVLGKNGGLMEKMLLPFRFHIGSIIGPGNQWMSWIHISDLVKAIRFLIENKNCSGPYNLTAPNPVQMRPFIETIGRTIEKPVRFKVPGLLLKIALGKMARETVLASQNILPAKLLEEQFEFEYRELAPALEDLLSIKKS